MHNGENENEDNWKHRSTGMRCATCMWYVQKPATTAQTPSRDIRLVRIGRCRKHAPTMNGYPVVFSGDWCGDHKLHELSDE